MKKQNIEDIFSSIENFSSVPPPELWDNIEEQLDKPKKKKRAIVWWSAAACLLLGLSIPSGLYFNSRSGKSIPNSGAVENNNVVFDKKGDLQKNSETVVSKEKNNSIKPEKTVGVATVPNKSEQKSTISATQNKTVVAETNGLNSATSAKNANAKEKIQNENLSNGLSNNQNSPLDSKNSISNKSNAVASNAAVQNKTNSEEAVANENLVSKNKNAVASNTAVQNKRNSEAVANENLVSKNKNAVASNSPIQNKTNEKETVANENLIAKSKNAVASNSSTQKKTNEKETVANENLIAKNKNAVASKSPIQNKTNEKETVANENLIAKNKNAVASKSPIQNKTNEKETVAKENLIAKSKNAVVSNSSNEKKTKENFNSKNKDAVALNSSHQNKINTNHSGEKTSVINTDKAVSFNQNSNSILLSKKDSIQLAELNSLEEAIKNPKKEKEEIINPIAKAEKWSVEVFAGIANSENYKNDKTLGNVNSSKQSNAYGVKTNYKLNKKWAVSSGLKINELGQSIANISYINTKSIAYMSSEGISANRAPSSSQITNNADYVFVAVPNNKAQNAVSSGSVNTASFESGNVDQRLKYLEMPFEVSFFLLNKNKTSVSLNTGGFVGKLISNDVYLNGTAIGDNQNANDFVYGSLLSSTLQYRLYKKTNVFVEPGMNYYANPLNNQSFNQFQWSFNFGLNVSF